MADDDYWRKSFDERPDARSDHDDSPSEIIGSNGIYLPVPKVGEMYTHLDCPECDYGEVVVKKADQNEC